MRAFLALLRKNLADSRWLLLALCSALFGLSYLFVKAASGFEARVKAAGLALGIDLAAGPPGIPGPGGPGGPGGRGPGGQMRMLRAMGGSAMDFSSAAIEVTYWTFPVISPLFAAWAIARGSAAVAGEIEKGTMDLVMSRPVGRSTFLMAQVASATFGLLLMAAMMVAGNLVAARYYPVETPPSAWLLGKPALNLFALGWAVYGYSLLLSTYDHVRWRPNLIAAVATLAGFIAPIIAGLPTFEDYKKYLEAVSVFKAYNPVEAVTKGETLAFNAGILGVVGAVGIALGFLIFARRDLPAGS